MAQERTATFTAVKLGPLLGQSLQWRERGPGSFPIHPGRVGGLSVVITGPGVTTQVDELMEMELSLMLIDLL